VPEIESQKRGGREENPGRSWVTQKREGDSKKEHMGVYTAVSNGKESLRGKGQFEEEKCSLNGKKLILKNCGGTNTPA